MGFPPFSAICRQDFATEAGYRRWSVWLRMLSRPGTVSKTLLIWLERILGRLLISLRRGAISRGDSRRSHASLARRNPDGTGHFRRCKRCRESFGANADKL